MVLITVVLSLFFAAKAQAFVLLSGPVEAHLAVDEADPKITFVLSMTPPPITNKEEFMDGAYTELSDEDFWLMLVKKAMEPWNAVADAYVDLDVELSSNAEMNGEDQIYSIVVGKTNLTSSASADPNIVGTDIVDCDINISERSADASDLAFTLMHELGHCLGLGHNHSDYSAVMGYSRTDRSLRLGLDDEAGLIFLYPLASLGKARELAFCGTILGGQKNFPDAGLYLFMPIAIVLIQGLRRTANKASQRVQ